MAIEKNKSSDRTPKVRKRAPGGGRKPTVKGGLKHVVKADISKDTEDRYIKLEKTIKAINPALTIHKADLARRGFEKELELFERTLKGGADKILTPEQRHDLLLQLGQFFQPIQQEYPIATTNAGPWRETLDENVSISAIDLLDFKFETDMLWRVSRLEEEGDCLSGDDIWPGDILHLRAGEVVANEDIVLAMGIDTQSRAFATVKHYHEENGVIELRPSNPKCKIIKSFPGSVEIRGVVINAIRKGIRRGGNGRSRKR